MTLSEAPIEVTARFGQLRAAMRAGGHWEQECLLGDPDEVDWAAKTNAVFCYPGVLYVVDPWHGFIAEIRDGARSLWTLDGELVPAHLCAGVWRDTRPLARVRTLFGPTRPELN